MICGDVIIEASIILFHFSVVGIIALILLALLLVSYFTSDVNRNPHTMSQSKITND